MAEVVCLELLPGFSPLGPPFFSVRVELGYDRVGVQTLADLLGDGDAERLDSAVGRPHGGVKVSLSARRFDHPLTLALLPIDDSPFGKAPGHGAGGHHGHGRQLLRVARDEVSDALKHRPKVVESRRAKIDAGNLVLYDLG